MHPVFVQAFYYGIWGLLCFLGVGALLRGFFWKYVKVRTSFGKLIMVKIRTPLRDYFEIGQMEDDFLVYKHNKITYRLVVNHALKPFYRCLAVVWIDVDDQNHAICMPDYTVVPGYDLQKHDSVVARAQMRPSIKSNTEMIIMICVIVTMVAAIVCILLCFKNGSSINVLTEQILSMKGTIIGTSAHI